MLRGCEDVAAVMQRLKDSQLKPTAKSSQSQIKGNTNEHVARLQVMRLRLNHSGSDQSASYEDLLAVMGMV